MSFNLRVRRVHKPSEFEITEWCKERVKREPQQQINIVTLNQMRMRMKRKTV